MKQSKKKELKNEQDFFKKDKFMAKHIKFNGNMEVKKADVVVKARYKLNPLSLKFITALITGLKRSDDINEEYIFRVKDFQELTKLKRKDLYWAIKKALKELLEKPLHIPNDNGFIMCNWISGGHYIENLGEVRFMIYPKLRPYLLEAKEKFLKYKLGNILSLKSSYSIRLYEILKDNFNLNSNYGKDAKLELDLDEFRQMLEIPKSYKFNDIKRFILEKAKRELSEHTDIIFDYEEMKTGRKVTHIKFYIKANPAKIEDETNKKFERIFKNRSAFVAFLRQNYAGTGKAFGYRTIEGKKWWLKLDKNGLLYGSPGAITLDEINNLASLTKEFNSVESGELYDLWFKIAQNSNIYKDIITQNFCLYEIWKKNKELYLELQKDIILLQEQGII